MASLGFLFALAYAAVTGFVDFGAGIRVFKRAASQNSITMVCSNNPRIDFNCSIIFQVILNVYRHVK